MATEQSTGPQATWERYLQEGRFMLQRAKKSGEHLFWPRVSTPSGDTDLEWVEASGKGTVYAITVNRSRSGSTNIALIELEEGPRMMSTLPTVETAPIGTRVAARIETEGEAPRVVFDPADEGAAA